MAEKEKKEKTKEQIEAEKLEKVKEKDVKDNRSKAIEKLAQIIAVVSPYSYSTNPEKIIKLVKAGKFWEAVKEAKPREPDAGEQFKLSYNSSSEGLEPIYFWILDFIGADGVDKLVDNFASSPGSGHFAEMGQRATRMQEEGMKVMQTIGVLIKSVINIIYDLRQFDQRLADYANSEKDDISKKEAGILALKQIWLDNVDIKRGNTSIKAMTFSQQGAFVTLLNAFLAVTSIEEVDKLDLNEIVKRILKQRIEEFDIWRKMSKTELTKRYNIEKAWLKSQVDSLKLYSSWAKPYFVAAEQLKSSTSLSNSAALVKSFNTNLMQLTILKSKGIKVADSVISRDLPPGFEKLDKKGAVRKYNSCMLIDFKFRGIPQRVDQHYAFGGKADVSFSGYALTDEELAEFKKRVSESDLQDALKLVDNVTESSLKEIQDDITYFLGDKEREEEKKEEKKEETSTGENPFTALIGKGTFWGKEEKKEAKPKDSLSSLYKTENYAEKTIRDMATLGARKSIFVVYDIYKKAHGMASVPLDTTFDRKNIDVGFFDLFKG